ncbi:MAG: methyltransferase domain-containing protein [Leptolyngbyaceae cyanobacterium bins.302]|nr:methyltransferase domain-containing protein [Leptolyngbyaceae cyanobacterium bins.302]
MVLATLLNQLRLPESFEISDLDEPANIHILRKIIQRKPFLYNTYRSFYHQLLRAIEQVPEGEVVELGSGASFLQKYAPQITTSDVLPYEGVDRVFSALDMPFSDSTVAAFVMVDVFHHLQDSRQFFQAALRCLKPGGKIVMVEPANTAWSRFVYTNFHHEPFETRGWWGFDTGGPLSGANMALPWIVFCRDRRQFQAEFPGLRICTIRIHTPFRYLLSGGLSFRQLLPSWTYPLVEAIESLLTPVNSYLGMFMTIELEKIDSTK